MKINLEPHFVCNSRQFHSATETFQPWTLTLNSPLHLLKICTFKSFRVFFFKMDIYVMRDFLSDSLRETGHARKMRPSPRAPTSNVQTTRTWRPKGAVGACYSRSHVFCCFTLHFPRFLQPSYASHWTLQPAGMLDITWLPVSLR